MGAIDFGTIRTGTKKDEYKKHIKNIRNLRTERFVGTTVSALAPLAPTHIFVPLFLTILKVTYVSSAERFFHFGTQNTCFHMYFHVFSARSAERFFFIFAPPGADP